MALPGLSLSLPGLSMSSTPTGNNVLNALPTAAPRHIDLEAETEFRFEVNFSQILQVKLLTGTAELFGTELAPTSKEYYRFTGTKAAIYTWHGCRLELVGDTESEYIAAETTMNQMINTHFALYTERQRIADLGTSATLDDIGPRVLIVGPPDSGKTTLAKTLTSYAVKQTSQPMVINLDPRQAMLSVPGTLTAAVISSILDVEEPCGWGDSPISGPNPVPVKMPLVYHLGLPAPDDSGKIFRPLITRMAVAISSRFTEDPDARIAGCIIDTPGSIAVSKNNTYDHIAHIISEFSVNVVLVLGSERIYTDLSKKYASRPNDDQPIHIIKLDKSEGVVARDEVFMKALRARSIRAYFDGTHPSTRLSPQIHWVDFSALSIFKLLPPDAPSSGSNPDLAEEDYLSTLTEYTQNNATQLKLYNPVTPSLKLQNNILAITSAGPKDSHEVIRDACILGYMYIADVDETKKRVKVLAVSGSKLPDQALVWGEWPEEVAGLIG